MPVKSKDAGKRLFCERTPDQNNRSPSVKSQRVKSPEKIISSRKSLNFGKDAESRKTCVQDKMLSKLNIDDLPAAEELQVKVVSLNDGKVKVHLPSDLTIKKLICCLALKEWKTASNLVLKHAELREELKVSFGKAISEEFKNYFKAGTILQATEPEELATFSNNLLIEEVRVFCPLWHHCVLGATGLKEDDIKACGRKTNSVALVSSVVLRTRNCTASAAHYRISSILFHSGAKFLNHLGVCMSPTMVVSMQRKIKEFEFFK